MKRSVVFLGTPDASVIVLEKLAQHHRIELVVTQPDKKRGRGSALVPSPVKLAAQKHGISIAHELAALDQLPENDDRVYIVVAYGRIIPRDVLERHPMINVHFSLLPRWRGAAPVERAIIAGDKTTGVCIMQIEPALDTGPVYARVETEIADTDTATTLTNRLASLGAGVLLELLEKGLGEPVPQNGEPTYAHKIESSERLITWHESSTQIWRRVRALSCYGKLNDKRLGLIEVKNLPEVNGEIGSVTADGVVYAEDGAVQLIRVQPEGKSVMLAADWLRGLRDLSALRFDTSF